MPLGVEYSNTAPQLIQNAGQALVQGIRQIGQQVSSHLTEIQTRRDIGALGQELQNISVQSPDWSTQVTGLLSRHPLAARDERAQMALSILSKAHNQWQENQAAVRNPYRSMAGGGVYNSTTGEVTTAPTYRPVTVGPNSRLVDPETGEVVVEPLPVQDKPFTLSPGAARYGPDGKLIVERPKPKAELTDFQKHQIEKDKRKERRAALQTELDAINRDIEAFEDTFHKTRNREKDAGKEELPQIKTEISQLGTQLQALKEVRDAKVMEMAKIDKEDAKPAPPQDTSPYPTETLPPVPPNAVAPPLTGAVPAPSAGNPNERVEVIDPQGKRGYLPRKQVESALKYGFRLP